MRKLFVATATIFLFVAQTASAAVNYSQQVTLAPGWNIVSTPRIVESHTFSAPETLANFSIYILDASRPSGWATMSELGQIEFTPLYGYFVNNKGTSTQTLTFNYKDMSAVPEQRFFERKFTQEGWYSFGVANPSYAKEQGSTTVDTDNPDHILNSLLDATSNYDSVVDFTDASYASNTDAVALNDPWKLVARSADVTNTTEINSLNDFRETKGYAIYIKNATATLNGFQNADVPQCTDGVDNDEDGKTDYPADFGCGSTLDDDEYNAPAEEPVLEKWGYLNQTAIVPQTAFKIGEYRLTTGNDDFVLAALGLSLASSTANVENLSHVYLVVGTTTSTIYETPDDTLIWYTSMFIPAYSTLSIAAYATLPSSMIGGETVLTDMAVGGHSSNTGEFILSDDVRGQTITIGNGSLSAAVDASTPVSSLVVANSMPKIASFKFTASNDSFTLTELTAMVASENDAAAIIELVFKSGATELARAPFDSVYATATGFTVSLPSNSNKVIDVYANLGSVGTGFANSGANVGVTLTGYKALNSSGIESPYSVNLSGNNMYVYKTKPVITSVTLPSISLTLGGKTVAKFNITADAGGTVAWQKINFTVATSGAGSAPALTGFALYDAADESIPLAGVTVTQNSAGTVVTASSTVGVDQQVSGSKTYVLKATVNGTLVTDYSVSTNIASGGATFAAPTTAGAVATAGSTNFIWSDLSATPHSAVTADWNNDYLLKNLPTDSQTLTK